MITSQIRIPEDLWDEKKEISESEERSTKKKKSINFCSYNYIDCYLELIILFISSILKLLALAISSIGVPIL